MVMIVNFADSDFSMYIMDAAKIYCEKYSQIVTYWKHCGKDYTNKLTEVFSDVKHIQDFFY